MHKGKSKLGKIEAYTVLRTGGATFEILAKSCSFFSLARVSLLSASTRSHAQQTYKGCNKACNKSWVL